MTFLLQAGKFYSLGPLLWNPELFGVCGVPLGYQLPVSQYWKLAFSTLLSSPRVCTVAPCPSSAWGATLGVGAVGRAGRLGCGALHWVLWLYWSAGISTSAVGLDWDAGPCIGCALALLGCWNFHLCSEAACSLCWALPPCSCLPRGVTRSWFPQCFVADFASLSDEVVQDCRTCLKAQKSGFFKHKCSAIAQVEANVVQALPHTDMCFWGIETIFVCLGTGLTVWNTRPFLWGKTFSWQRPRRAGEPGEALLWGIGAL